MMTMIPYRHRYFSRPVKPFESIMNDPFFRSFFSGSGDMLSSSFRVDIRDNQDAFVIEAEMPGLSEEQITLEVNEGVLTISAHYQTHTEQEDAGKMYSERRSGRMQRSFNLDSIDADSISANLKNGILYVNLPKEKPVEKSARRIPVHVDQPKIEES